MTNVYNNYYLDPKIETDSKINYEVESKYMEWSMS